MLLFHSKPVLSCPSLDVFAAALLVLDGRWLFIGKTEPTLYAANIAHSKTFYFAAIRSRRSEVGKKPCKKKKPRR